MAKPEQEARERIDALLADAGWCVQDADAVNLHAGRGIALREFPLIRGHGFADYPARQRPRDLRGRKSVAGAVATTPE